MGGSLLFIEKTTEQLARGSQQDELFDMNVYTCFVRLMVITADSNVYWPVHGVCIERPLLEQPLI